MSNFAFLQSEWPEIHTTAARAESYLNRDPRTACFHARRALELAVNWLYTHDSAYTRPYDTTLITLLNDISFKENTPYEIGSKAHYIRKLGNLAVHSKKKINTREAFNTTKELYHLLYWLASTYTGGDPEAIPTAFNETLIPPSEAKAKQKSIKQLKLLDEQLHAKDEELAVKQKALEDYQAQLEKMQAKISTAKKTNSVISIDHDYSEAETRTHLIDLLLREAGWDPHGENVPEYEVTGMPNKKGIGYVDYVLWGQNGKPIGLVEAKRTSVDSKKGKRQAELYANSLESMHGQRPIIFYSNGYETWIWDDANYPERPVQGFYTQDELERLIQRRSTTQPFGDVPTQKTIVDRPYQEEAIRSIVDHLQKKHRRGLLVMATGSGKTRTTIALVDVLMRAGWAKRVLFLADRTALVRQAVGAFKRHLPESNPINLLDDKEARESRVVVSTYQTMMGMIDETVDDQRARFSVGHFDLVIIDEAHRSVYHKFGAIFDYFDSLLLGLTATPKDEVDRNTYRLFELEDGVPVFHYELDQAVADGFLVPLRAMGVSVKFQREGIKYDDLSDDEKLEWDLIEWGEDTDPPDHVSSSALNTWLFNEDTVDKVLEHLMRHGIKVKAGDRLGKTIIFAKNHNHAEFIQERFDKNYPHLEGKFARVIDHYQTYAQSLIDDFSKPDSDPHIAISVDMLDTGIDIPEIVNLVFFKVVRSKTKFWQMIGRGTRLSPDLFAPGQDKQEFIIFDYCGNFEFFNLNPQGFESRPQEPLSQRLFKLRLDLLEHYAAIQADDTPASQLYSEYSDYLHTIVNAIPTDNFIVRPKRRWVAKFQKKKSWQSLSQTDLADLSLHISGLPTTLTIEDESALRFDLLTMQLQTAFIEGLPKFNMMRDKIIDLTSQLETKINIPMVADQIELIRSVHHQTYWARITLVAIEDLRKNLRNLIQFIDRNRRINIYTDFTDRLGQMNEVQAEYGSTGVNILQYKKKVEQFIQQHKDHQVIRKIRFAMPLTSEDLLQLEEFFFEADETGTKEDFDKAYPGNNSLPVFIRALVGLDRKAAKDTFSSYLDDKVFSAEQIRFVNFIIDHLTQNGAIKEQLLYEQPYTDFHEYGLDGMFPKEADKLISIVRNINGGINASA